MDWSWLVALVVFIVIQTAGVLIAIEWFRSKGAAFPIYGRPREVFRLVRREDRAAYSRIMRRTVAVQMRDLGRAFNSFGREIGKRMLPAMHQFADAVEAAFGKRPPSP